MECTSNSPNVRKGRFLWMAKPAQDRYLETLRNRISSGYFWSDRILSRVVDDIAPIFQEAADCESPAG